MDPLKKRQLLERLMQQAPPRLVLIAHFFDGNDDIASIGPNLIDHPGIDAFRETLLDLADHAGVREIYAQIAELNPGEAYWPFADTLYVVGAIPAEVVAVALDHLQPDAVAQAAPDQIPERIQRHYEGVPVVIVWWD